MPCPEAADEADRILQALALVNRGQPHHIRILIQDTCLAVVHIELVHLVNVAEEPEKTCIVALLEGSRLHEKRVEIRGSSCARRERPHIILVPRAADELADQLVNRRRRHLLPVVAKPGEKLPAVIAKCPGNCCSKDLFPGIFSAAGLAVPRSFLGPAAADRMQSILTFLAFRLLSPRLLLSRCREHTVIQELLPLVPENSPKRSDFILRESSEISAQHAVQGDVLSRIVNDAQCLQDCADFLCGKISSLVFEVQRNSFLLEHLPERILSAGGGAKENHHVAVPRRAKLPRLFIRHGKRSHQFTDSLGHGKSLLARGGERRNGVLLFLRGIRSSVLCPRSPVRFRIPGCLFLFPASVHQKELGLVRALPDPVLFRVASRFHAVAGFGFRRFRLRIAGPRLQGNALIVLHAADFPAHDFGENRVGRVQHFPPRAEILIQIDPLRLLVILAVGLVFFLENLRPCVPEAVNALLDISHHKAGITAVRAAGKSRPLFSRNGGKKKLLHLVAVLVLVDQNLVKILPVPFRGLPEDKGSVLFSLHQNLQCHVLQVREVDDISLLLDLLQELPVAERKVQKRPDRSLRLVHPLHRKRRILRDALQKGLHPFLQL